MITRTTRTADGYAVNTACSFCGKPIVTSGPSGMTCADRCADKWVRWDRLRRPAFQDNLAQQGKLPEALEELSALTALLFRDDGSPKFAGPPAPPKGRKAP